MFWVVFFFLTFYKLLVLPEPGLASVPWRPFAKLQMAAFTGLNVHSPQALGPRALHPTFWKCATLGPSRGQLAGTTQHLGWGQSSWPAPVTFLRWPFGSRCRCLSWACHPPAAQLLSPTTAPVPRPGHPASSLCSLCLTGLSPLSSAWTVAAHSCWSRPCAPSLGSFLPLSRVGTSQHCLYLLTFSAKW